MKTIAKTIDGTGYLMEVSDAEMLIFSRLEGVVKGYANHPPGSIARNFTSGKVNVDVSEILNLIFEYAVAKEQADKLRAAVQSLGQWFGKRADA